MLTPKVAVKASNLLNSILRHGVKDGIISDVDACRKFNPFRHVGKSFNCTSTKSELKISHAASVANASWTGPRFSNCKSMYPGYDISSDLPTLAPTNCTGAVCKSGGEGSVEFSWKTFVKKDMTATLKNATGREFGTIYHHVKQIFASNLETNEVELRGFRDTGGKMITYHGLCYQVPALGHYWGCKGGQPEALFEQLRAWVENGTEPFSTPVARFITARLAYDGNNYGLAQQEEGSSKTYVKSALTDWQGYKARIVQLMTVPPYVVASGLTIVAAHFSDKTQRRGLFVISSLNTALIGFAIAITTSDRPDLGGVTYAGCFIACCGFYPAFPGIVAWLANNAAGPYKRAISIGLQLSLGNLGGFVGSDIYLARQRPAYRLGYGISLGFIFCAIIAAGSIMFFLNRIN
ncbi:hypothetical protein FVER53590_04332 [Fusarium verticillioides]|nr:hypothetical protein FVER53590_04332 [Fusarium verticillioides]